MGRALRRLLLLGLLLLVGGSAHLRAEPAYPVGIRAVEFVTDDHRTLALHLFYPAAAGAVAGPRFVMPFYDRLDLFHDASIAEGRRLSLIMLSHGRGSGGLVYAWLAQALAEHGYVVAAIDHHRANTYDSSIVYLANKLWQRPVDLRLSIIHLLGDPFWGARLDPDRIGVAGHSQGGSPIDANWATRASRMAFPSFGKDQT
jgi:predicted dienelactone hydrolase